ncbi:MAG: LysR substrate-binding domain-containing protein [Candidatus Algichlamydia australiensis]|nr:LysR substrate-binding domain-containing protein [Chlamydiales bacterium]
MSIDTFILQTFIAIAETGSFTKAAKRVNRTQSAVSQQVVKLEKTLNQQLIVRQKTLTLTPAGQVFLGYARKIFALHSEVMDRFNEPDLEGEVRFGLPEDFASLFLSDVLADFSRIHPRILLNVECDLTINLFSHFKKNEFDLVLVKMNRPEDFPNGLEIWSEPLRWVGDPNLLDPNKPVPLVLAPDPCVYRAAGLKALAELNRAWRLVFTSPSYSSTVAAVKAGMGITVMPHIMIPDDLPILDFSFLPGLEDTHVSLLKHQANNSAINTLEKFVIQKLKH